MRIQMTRRRLVRLLSFALFLVLVLGVLTITAMGKERKKQIELSNAYMHAMGDFCDSVNNLEVTLQKRLYAGTNAQLSELSTKIWTEATAAKTALSLLPVDAHALESAYKFLSQAGDYAMSVTGGLEENQKIQKEDHDNLYQLYQCAKDLNQKVCTLREQVYDGSVTLSLTKSLEDVAASSSGIDGFHTLGEGFTDYPSLIYDGPFSDHLASRNSAYLDGMKEVDQNTARKAAADFLGVDQNTLQNDTDENSRIAAYCFQAVDLNVSVSKNGGKVLSLLNSRRVGDASMGRDEARAATEKYLKDRGFSNFRVNYDMVENGICVSNVTTVVGSYTVYPQMIKVGVALDNGEVVLFDAKPYYLHYQERKIPTAKISKEEAQQKVSNYLTVTSSSLAIIPSKGQYERPCYEFLCEGPDKEQVLVYINAETGREEQILILIQSEDGSLTI